MIVGDLVIADHHVMRQTPRDCFVEAAADGLFRDFEISPGSGASGVQLGKRLLGEVERRRRGIRLEVGASAVALDRVAPLRNLPLELHFRQRHCLRQIDLDTMSRRLDVADIDEAGQRGGPESRNRAPAGVEREIVARALVIPPRRHDPGVLVLEVAFLRFGNRLWFHGCR